MVQIDKSERIELTPLGEYLREGSESSFKDDFLLASEGVASHTALLHTLLTGESAFKHEYGVDYYQHIRQQPVLMKHFYRRMTNSSKSVATAVLNAFDFFCYQTIVDVGGGTGELISAILKRYTDSKGILFDDYQVADDAQRHLSAEGLANKCSVVTGNFFQSVSERAIFMS